jgi:hypothetical protein
MTTKMVWMWLGGCLINHNKTLKQTLFNALYKMLGKIWEHEIYQIQQKKRLQQPLIRELLETKTKAKRAP